MTLYVKLSKHYINSCNFGHRNFVEKYIFDKLMRIKIALLFFILSKITFAQLGGMGTYRFLYVSPNARIASLGGNAIATPDADLNLVSQNPSLLNKANQHQIGLNFVNYFADISAGEANYAWHSDSLQTSFAAGIQYLNYGSFTKTAPDGQVLGTFTAGEYNFHASAARTYKQFQYGMTLKFINSNLETYNSYGMAADIGSTWISQDKLMAVTAVISNIGMQFKSYTNANYESIPNNLQVGFSKKFEHNPFRISVIAQNLQNPGQLLYQIRSRQQISLETGEPIKEDFSIMQKAMSHLVINTEMILGRTLNIRFGYNALRQREMALSNIRGFNGFSWGFGIRLNRFQFSYGNGGYMPGKNTNAFTIITRLDDFKKSKTITP